MFERTFGWIEVYINIINIWFAFSRYFIGGGAYTFYSGCPSMSSQQGNAGGTGDSSANHLGGGGGGAGGGGANAVQSNLN